MVSPDGDGGGSQSVTLRGVGGGSATWWGAGNSRSQREHRRRTHVLGSDTHHGRGAVSRGGDSYMQSCVRREFKMRALPPLMVRAAWGSECPPDEDLTARWQDYRHRIAQQLSGKWKSTLAYREMGCGQGYLCIRGLKKPNEQPAMAITIQHTIKKLKRAHLW